MSAQSGSALEPVLECSNRNTSFHEICNGTLVSPCDCVTSKECQVTNEDILLITAFTTA